jgi:tetratricopeptide (TPR) repeat protein
MGLWPESAAVARDIVQTAEAGHPNYQPAVTAMARVILAEALLGDLRFEDARAAAAAALSGAPGTAWVGTRAERVLARCLDLERRAGAPEAESLRLLAQARRLREQGDLPAAEVACRRAFEAFPASDEGRLCAARESLRRGRPRAARELARAVLDSEGSPWLRPSARLVLARARESEGEEAKALELYRDVWEAPLGREELRREAAAAILRHDPWAVLPAAPPLER